MGDYTELVLKCTIKHDVPENVHKILKYLFDPDDERNEPTDLPDHPFFKTSRWCAIGSSNSAYHIPESFGRYDGRYLFSRSDLKNYEDEIDKFLDWLDPYIRQLPETCIGWTWDEYDDSPELIYNKGVIEDET